MFLLTISRLSTILLLASVLPLSFAQDAKIRPSSANNVQWINPMPGSSVSSGQALLASWRADAPVSSPSFALCTSEDSCGEASWPKVVDYPDGTSSTTLALPAMNSLNGMYLKMKGDDESTYSSPAFDVGGPGDTGSAVASPSVVPGTLSDPYDYAWTPVMTEPATIATTVMAESTPVVSMPMVEHPTTMSPALQSSINPYSALPTNTPIETTAIPFALPSTAQIPYSVPPSPSLIPFSGQNSLSDSSLSTIHTSTRPSAVAIAVPLAICALILLSALVFCARTKAFRKPGAGTNDLEGRDWQSVIREKAAAAKAASASGVVLTERTEEVAVIPNLAYRSESPYQRDEYQGAGRRSRPPSEMSSRSGTRCLTPIREGEYFTAIPVSNYARRALGQPKDPRRFDPHPSHEYYATSRRSSSSLGGTRTVDSCPCAYHDRQAWSQPREKRFVDCVREGSIEGSIYNPHPPVCSSRHPSSLSHSWPARPLPEPMIRTSSTYTETIDHRRERGGYWEREQCAPPHTSGVLERAGSSASTDMDADWEAERRHGRGSVGGRVAEGEREMGELYESLRRAIGTPR